MTCDEFYSLVCYDAFGRSDDDDLLDAAYEHMDDCPWCEECFESVYVITDKKGKKNDSFSIP